MAGEPLTWLFPPDKEQWGGWLSCVRCGHPASYHGVTFCMVDAGAAHKHRCDCKGWFAWSPERRLLAAPSDAPEKETP